MSSENDSEYLKIQGSQTKYHRQKASGGNLMPDKVSDRLNLEISRLTFSTP
jgi:hypothetical protein